VPCVQRLNAIERTFFASRGAGGAEERRGAQKEGEEGTSVCLLMLCLDDVDLMLMLCECSVSSVRTKTRAPSIHVRTNTHRREHRRGRAAAGGGGDAAALWEGSPGPGGLPHAAHVAAALPQGAPLHVLVPVHVMHVSVPVPVSLRACMRACLMRRGC
jgi:hypothetical protein